MRSQRLLRFSWRGRTSIILPFAGCVSGLVYPAAEHNRASDAAERRMHVALLGVGGGITEVKIIEFNP